MAHPKPLYVEHLALNKRKPYYHHPGKAPTYMHLPQKDLDKYELPMAPAAVKEHPDPAVQDERYYSGHPDYYKPKRPAGMPAVALSEQEKEEMHNRLEYCGRGRNRLPAVGWQWCEERVKRPRTMTEDDLADLAEARSKYQRYKHDAPRTIGTQTDEPLKMYSICRSPNAPGTYDTFVGAVVVARNEDEAKFIHPSYGYPDPSTNEKPWWEYGGRWGSSIEFTTRQEAYDEETMARYRKNKDEPPEPCPPHFLGRHTDWPHPAYVRATLVCDYYGAEKAGFIVSSDFWPG